MKRGARVRTGRAWLVAGSLLLAIGPCGCGRPSAPPVPPDLPYRMPSEQEATRTDPAASEAIPLPPQGPRGTEAPAPDGAGEAQALRFGYRVQLFATGDGALAEARAAELRRLFEEQVYVEAEGPLYKVRVGDCLSRDEASTLRQRALGMGLEGAFVVDAQVRVR